MMEPPPPVSNFALAGIIILAAVLVVAFDLYAYAAHGVHATLSRTVWENAKEYPIIPFSVGVLIGHLFW
jgi:hypothetical protein